MQFHTFSLHPCKPDSIVYVMLTDSIAVESQLLQLDGGSTSLFSGTFVTEMGHMADKRLDLAERSVNQGLAGWENIVMLTLLLLIVVMRQLIPRKFGQAFLAATANNQLNQMLREWNPAAHFTGFLFISFYIVSFSMLIFQSIKHLPYETGEITGTTGFYFIINVAVSLVVLSKLILVKVLGKLFRTKQASQNYLANQFTFWMLGGVYFTVLLFAFAYGHGWPKPAIVVITVSIFMVYRIIRSFLSSLPERNYSLLYLFLYLCALEIVPLLLLVKTVFKIGGGMLII